jgi:hypothetical protein
MPVHDGQFSFANGEISPDIQGRTDVELYKSSAKTLRNFIPSPHGPVYNRAGTYFCGLTKYNNTKTRLIPFAFSDAQSYMLEFGYNYIRFWKNGGLVLENDLVTNSTPNTTPWGTYDAGTNYAIYQAALSVGIGWHYISIVDNNLGNDQHNSAYWKTLYDWDISTGYVVGDYVRNAYVAGAEYRYFRCTQNNVGNDPLTSPSFWIEVNRIMTSTSSAIINGWIPNQSFIKDEYAKVSVGSTQLNVYRSLINANIGNDPSSSPASWQIIAGANEWGPGINYGTGQMTYVVDSVIKFFISKSNQSNHNPLTTGSTYWSQIVNTPPYEVGSPYLDIDLPKIKFTQSADTIYLAHPSYPPQVLQRISDNNWTLTPYAFKNGPFMLANTDTTKSLKIGTYGQSLALIATGCTPFNSQHVGSLWKVNTFQPSNTLINVWAGQQGQRPSDPYGIPTSGDWQLVTSGTWAGTVILEKSVDGGVTWIPEKTFTSGLNNSQSPINVNTFGTIENDGTFIPMIRLNINLVVYSSQNSGQITATLTSNSYYYPAILKVLSIIDSSHVLCTTKMPIQNANAVYGKSSTDWAEGSFSLYRGWPGAVAFLQDRLVWGSTPSEPQTEWMTKTSNYVDFGRSSPLVDSDGITLNLTSRKVNGIESLLTFLTSLIAFTASSEWTTASDSGGAITPSTAFIKLQGTRGSSELDPFMIGNKIFMNDSRGTCVREMTYQFYTDTFETENISTKADFLFKGHSIVAWAYQQEPDSIIWMVRDDGILITCTYLKEQQVLAWAHHDTAGTYESVATIPGTGVDEVWFVVQRGSARYIERMLQRTLSTDPADQYFVDCGISYNGAPAQTLTGYDHLNGMTVAINADGFVLPQQVVTNGTVTLDAPHSKVQVGLPYLADLETLNIEIPSKEGVFQGTRYNLNRAVFRFLNSRGGLVGMDSSTLTDVIDQRDPALDASIPTPLFSDYVAQTIPQNNDGRGHIMFRQVDPMPVTIVSIVPLVNPGKNP